MVACSGNAIEGIIEFELGPAVFVVLNQQHGLPDDCFDRALILFWQTIEQTRWHGLQNDRIARFRRVHSTQ